MSYRLDYVSTSFPWMETGVKLRPFDPYIALSATHSGDSPRKHNLAR